MVHILFLAHGAPGNLFSMERRLIGLQRGARLAEIRLYDLRVPDEKQDWWITRLCRDPGHYSPENPLGKVRWILKMIGALLGYKPRESSTSRLGWKESFNPWVYVAVIGVKKDALIRGAEII